MSSSPGPTGCRNADILSASARAIAAAASPTRSPIATTDGPCTIWCECASPSGSVLTTRLIAPCEYRATCFDRCRPVSRNPSPSNTASSSAASSSDTANSTHSTASGSTRGGHPPRMHPVVEPDQRPLPVLGDAPRRGHAEAVVEDLVAEPAVVAGGQHRRHELVDRQVPLPREVAEVPRPLQQVHVHPRRVRQLHEGHPVRRDRPDRVARQPPRQHVPAVEDHPHRRMVRPPHDLPGVAIVGDMPPPGQRLEPHLDAEPLRDLPELAQIRRRPVDPAEARRRDVGADEDRAAPRARSSARTSACARSKPRLRCGSGIPSKSRNGWKATISSPSSRTIRPISAGEPSLASTSASKISTPSKPAAAIAASFSGSVPPRETVAIENFMACIPRMPKEAAPGGRRPSFC